jgi:exosome complex exonuclease RRP6
LRYHSPRRLNARQKRWKRKSKTLYLVVVGQARQKRKRPKAGVGGVDGAEAASGSTGGKMKKTKVKKETEAKDEDREAFDFSTIPNILDDNPNVEDGNAKKKKRKKEKKGKRIYFILVEHYFLFIYQTLGGMFYGDFPAPPKAFSELKSGNQSHSFK